MKRRRRGAASAILAGFLAAGFVVTAPRAAHAAVQPTQGGAPLFTHVGYDYGASALKESGDTKAWWCGQGTPGVATGYPDTIFFSQYTDSTASWSTPQPVIAPQAGDWDENAACDPTVISVPMVDPANGLTYQYECYYGSATNTQTGDGDVGMAFSNDGINWVKYPTPLVVEQGPATNTYGAGQPTVIDLGGTAGFLMIHEDTSVNGLLAMWARHSTDGVHFGAPTKISFAGDPLVTPSMPLTGGSSHFAYDPSSGNVIGALEGIVNTGDRESRGFGVWQMPLTDFEAGTGTWQYLGDVDSALTNTYLNLDPSILRDAMGDVPTGTPITAWWAGGGNDPTTWDLYSATVTPSLTAIPLRQYSAQDDIWDTTGVAETVAGAGGLGLPYTAGPVIADLATIPSVGMIPVTQCFVPSAVSPPEEPLGSQTLTGPGQHYLTAGSCGSAYGPALSLGIEGWVYSYPALGTAALYVCHGAAPYVTTSATTCPFGGASLGVLGYAYPATAAPATWTSPAPPATCTTTSTCPATPAGSIVFPLNAVDSGTSGDYLPDTSGAYQAQVTGSTAGGAVSMIPAPAQDPYGLAAEITQTGATGTPYLSVSSLPFGTGTWTLTFDIQAFQPTGGSLNNPNPAGLATVNEFPLAIGSIDSAAQQLYLQLFTGDIVVASQDSSGQIDTPDVLLDGQWHTVSLAATTTALTLTVDGHTLGVLPLQAPIAGNLPVRLGYYYSGNPVGFTGALGDLELTGTAPPLVLVELPAPGLALLGACPLLAVGRLRRRRNDVSSAAL